MTYIGMKRTNKLSMDSEKGISVYDEQKNTIWLNKRISWYEF